jgi:hypothetical protein
MNNIIGIPLSNNPPEWQSSTPTPEEQLRDLGSRGPFVDKLEDYNRCENLASLVEGKRVALVCPSPHLKGLGRGEELENYDVICRVNQNFDMPEHMWNDYGKRTDINFNCVNEYKIIALANNLEFARSVKFYVVSHLSMWDIGRQEKFLNILGVPWHNPSDGYYFKFFREVGTTCNSGLNAVAVLLNYGVKELHVAGMTFFNMNKMGKVYNDLYHDEAKKYNHFTSNENREPTPDSLRMDIHHQQPQIDYFRKIVAHHHGKKLTLDDYLIENFAPKDKE